MTTTINGKATDLITFSRGSLATVTDSNGLIKWAPHNLLTYSEQFDNAAWITAGATVSVNVIVSPDGTTSAEKLVEDSATAEHKVRRSITVAAGTHTQTVYAKAGERNYLVFREDLDGSFVNTFFNLLTGAVVSTGAGRTSSITDAGNGWYRCSVTADATVATKSLGFGISSDGVNASYTGDGTSGLYLWGASLTRSDLGGMQANASAYPYYNPTTPKNLLGYSEAFDSAFWTKNTGVSVVANAETAPNGSLTADQVTFASGGTSEFLRQPISMVVNTTYTFSVYARLVSGSATFTVDYGNIGTSSTLTPTSVWQRFSYTFTFTGSNSWIDIQASAGCTIAFWGAQLSDSASLDPYSPVFGAAPSAAAYHGPRLDYDGDTLAARGLLVEETRTNVVYYTEDFRDPTDAGSSRPWVYSNVSLSINAGAAPDGISSADLLYPASSGSTRFIYQNPSTSSSLPVTGSLFVKASGKTSGFLLDASGNIGGYFDLTGDGAVSFIGGRTGSITKLANSWFRVSVTYTDVARYIGIGPTDTYGNASVTVNGTDGILIWGAQLEVNASFPSSYIPNATNSAGVTRNADVASVGVSQFPYSSTEGTIVAKLIVDANGDRRHVSLTDGTTNKLIDLFRSNGTNKIAGTVVNGSSQFTATNGPAATTGQVVKHALAFKAGDFAYCANGGTVDTQASGTVPTGITKMNIGFLEGSSVQYANGHIQQITYIPRRLSNAELQQRTL